MSRKVRVREAYVVEPQQDNSSGNGRGFLLLAVMGLIVFGGYVYKNLNLDQLSEMSSSLEGFVFVPAQGGSENSTPNESSSNTVFADNYSYLINLQNDTSAPETNSNTGFKVEKTMIFRCRSQPHLSDPEQEYVMAWWMKYTYDNERIVQLNGNVDLLSIAPHMPLMTESAKLFPEHLNAGSGILLQAKHDGDAIISGNGAVVGAIRLTLEEPTKKVPVGFVADHHQNIKVHLIEQTTYSALADYERYNIRLNIQNGGDMPMNNVQVVGIVAQDNDNSHPHALDLLEMNSSVRMIASGGQKEVTITSSPYMDRCVQKPLVGQQRFLHLWISFASVNPEHVLTQYLVQPLPVGQG